MKNKNSFIFFIFWVFPGAPLRFIKMSTLLVYEGCKKETVKVKKANFPYSFLLSPLSFLCFI